MSVRLADGVIWLEGRCLVEDAETLLLATQQEPRAPVDITGVQRLHLAVLQVLLVLQPRLQGAVDDAFLARHIFNSADLTSDKSGESS